MYEGNIAHSQSTNYKTKDEQHDVFIHTSFRFMFWEYFFWDNSNFWSSHSLDRLFDLLFFDSWA